MGRVNTKEKEHDLELEKTRLISLALDFGFDQPSATKCLHRLISLYGEDGRDFITVEHCGDDFIAALAESMEDTEEWDDLQGLESEACGALSQVLHKTGVSGGSGGGGDGEVFCVDALDDSPGRQKHKGKVVELVSSEEDEDEDVDFSFLMGREKCVTPGSAKSMV
ncbi:hypothetical protein PIB30_066377 [Stylosanthes scabra]|uniref:Uncharacterized protein n=1 Tax=Stylosanthes scabra TaxID=79078 RepID=A0ABU6TPP5_9FABA|nr:hypothetical protein [Stylosanthes scabra]